jgi:metal-responsive CopG/Arc/MetJ family transcriptional regulator
MTRKKEEPLEYTTISVPTTLMEKVDEIIKSGKYGYKNRPDFVLEAMRKRMRELGYLE